MIRINGRGAVYGELWYEEELPANPGVDIVLHRQSAAPIANVQAIPFLSLVIDLSVKEDAIADGLGMEFIVDPESRLDEFRAFFDAFARQKSLAPADPRWLIAACKARQLALASASRNGETLVWHAYVMSGTTARLQHSGSYFRNKENDYRALVGRANRWLHWRTLLRFKEMGMERYDWGGLFEDESAPERAGINNFKRSFGGRQERTYDCTLPVTFKGRVYLPLRDAWRRRKSIVDLPWRGP